MKSTTKNIKLLKYFDGNIVRVTQSSRRHTKIVYGFLDCTNIPFLLNYCIVLPCRLDLLYAVLNIDYYILQIHTLCQIGRRVCNTKCKYHLLVVLYGSDRTNALCLTKNVYNQNLVVNVIQNSNKRKLNEIVFNSSLLSEFSKHHKSG